MLVCQAIFSLISIELYAFDVVSIDILSVIGKFRRLDMFGISVNWAIEMPKLFIKEPDFLELTCFLLMKLNERTLAPN